MKDIRRRALAMALAALVITTSASLVPPSAAAAPSAAWQISGAPFTSNFEPGAAAGTIASGQPEQQGPALSVNVRNEGAEATSGSFKVEIELPVGLAASAPAFGELLGHGSAVTCGGAAGDQVVTCEGTEKVPPSSLVQVQVPLEVAPGITASTLVSQAKVYGGEAGEAQVFIPVAIGPSALPFDFVEGASGLFGSLTSAAGVSSGQAGAQPFQFTTGLTLPTYLNVEPLASGGGLRNVNVALPRGFVVNPNATPVKCAAGDLETLRCPAESQVGVALVTVTRTGVYNSQMVNVFNLQTTPGSPAELGFEVAANVVVRMRGHVSADGSYILSASVANALAKLTVAGAAITLWGVPSDPSHDETRGPCGDYSGLAFEKCPVAGVSAIRTGVAFLSLPGDCEARPFTVNAAISSWEEPANWHHRSAALSDGKGNPVSISGCEKEPFEPSIEAEPTTARSDSPSGLKFNLHQRQLRPYEEISPAPLKDVRVSLPAGMTVNPASADGLDACSEQQIGYAPSEGKIRFDEVAQTCPNGSKIGTLSVTTPLLDHALPGAVYLAKPFDNPFGSLLSIYLAVEDEKSGITAKLAGEVQTDPSTGQITAVFKENPELPLEDIRLSIFGGDRGSLQTPPVCGSYQATSRMTPWSTPQGADATPSSAPFQVTESSAAGACPTQESNARNKPNLSAGTVTAKAGAYSPFVMRITRGDGSQRIGKIEATLPPGLTGKLAGIPYCSDSQIAAAKEREKPNQGAAEISSPSCPAASEVGTVTVGAGAGSKPYYVKGHAYLAGPYKGAPLSLVIITPAVAGPFDLGTVVVRSALQVDQETAQIRAVSDPIPSIISGIPLDVRSIAVDMSRPEFTLNPTSCNRMAVLGSSVSTLGQTAEMSDPFQVGGCNELGFKPKLKMSLRGATGRTGHPQLKAVVTYPKQGRYANIARAQVGLPHSEFLDQSNLDKVCTQPQLKANSCPKSSVYGWAKAWSPLLSQPLQGPVYLGVGYGHKLPDLVADLNGQIRILLHGRVDTTRHEGLRNTFEVVPDAPVSRFVLKMKGGKRYGLLVNSENICAKKQLASARFVGHDGTVLQMRPRIANSCGKKKGSKRHKQQKPHRKG